METSKSAAQKTSFVKQAAILAVAGLLVRVMGFAYRIPLTNLIGDKGNGYYGAGYYIYTFFLILSSAGLPAAISKMVSERTALKKYRNAHEVFKIAMWISGILGLVCSLVLWFGAEWISNVAKVPQSYASILTLSPTVFIVALMAVFRGYFQGLKNTVPTAVSQIIEQIFNAVFSVYLAYVFVGQSIELGAAGGTAGTGIGALVGLFVIAGIYFMVRPVLHRKFTKQTVRTESRRAIAFELMGTAFPIIVGTAIFSISNLIDMVMVTDRLIASNAFTPDEITALYGQLTGKYVVITTLPISIATTLATVAVPNIAASFVTGDKKMVQSKVDLSLKLAMVLSIPAAVGIGVLSEQILALLFPLYPEGGVLLQYGSISILFLAMAQILTGILQGTGHVYVPVIAAVCGALVKIPLNYFLIAIPEINALGAVLSTIGCYIVASVINLVILKRKTGVKPDLLSAFVKPVFASLIMGLGCYVVYHSIYIFLPSNIIATIAAILAGMFIYFVIMLIIRGITREDLQVIPMGRKLIKVMDSMGF